MKTLIEYSAAPKADRFQAATVEELKAIQSEIMDSEESSLQTEWSRDAWETDRSAVEMAITAAKQGKTIYVAQDEDGYYFATDGGSVKIKAIFRKHFNQSGEGDDYPTDFFLPSVELTDVSFIEMRPPATFADVPCDDCGLPAVRGHRMEDGAEYAYCASCDPGDEGDETNWDITPAGPLNEKVGMGEEEWEYETDNPDAIESDLDRCEKCISYKRVTA